jgi:hypothetical protein
MRLEFLPDGADECPLLRLYGWGDGEVSLLRAAAERLATHAERVIAVHQMPFVAIVGGITFTWTADPWDRGVLLPDDQRSFVMRLPAEVWADVAEIIRPFERDVVGFNWLLPVTEVRVLLSFGRGNGSRDVACTPAPDRPPLAAPPSTRVS